VTSHGTSQFSTSSSIFSSLGFWLGIATLGAIAVLSGTWLAYRLTPVPLRPQLPHLDGLDRWYARSVGFKVVNRTKDEQQVWQADAESGVAD
jgi:hypothetical protein